MVRPAGFEPATFGSGDQRSIHAELRAHGVQSQESSRIALGGRFGICVQIVSIQTLDRSSLVLRRGVRIGQGHFDTGETQELTAGDNLHATNQRASAIRQPGPRTAPL